MRVIEIEKEREREKEIETKIYCRFASLPFSLSVLRVLQLQFSFVILYDDLSILFLLILHDFSLFVEGIPTSVRTAQTISFF